MKNPLIWIPSRFNMDFYGTIKGGITFLKECQDQDKGIGIEIVKGKRSIDQNKLYWSYLTIISDETGNSVRSLHEVFKKEFLPPRFSQIMIKDQIFQHELPASTTDLDKSQFIDYLDKIASLTEIPIPNYEPNYDPKMQKM